MCARPAAPLVFRSMRRRMLSLGRGMVLTLSCWLWAGRALVRSLHLHLHLQLLLWPSLPPPAVVVIYRPHLRRVVGTLQLQLQIRRRLALIAVVRILALVVIVLVTSFLRFQPPSLTRMYCPSSRLSFSFAGPRPMSSNNVC